MKTQIPPCVPYGYLSSTGFSPICYESKGSDYYSPSYYGDLRLDHRKELLLAQLISKQSCILSDLSSNESLYRSFSRLLNHDSMTPSLMIGQMVDGYSPNYKDEPVLVIQDSCVLSFKDIAARLRDTTGFGYTINRDSWGCMLHPSLVISAQSGSLLGLSEMLIWARKESAFGYTERKGASYPIEHKSSYRWLHSAQRSKEQLKEASSITFIADRESDIYEALVSWPDQKTDFIIRSDKNRNIAQTPGKIEAYLEELPPAGSYTFTLEADKRINRDKRKATLHLRFATVDLLRPHKAKSTNIRSYPPKVKVQVVEARELDPPQGVEPIHWRLYTSHRVENPQMALQIIQWYRKRWYIEQLFRLLQKQGINIEANRLFSAMAIIRFLIMAIEAAAAILKLNLAYKEPEKIEIDQVFDTKKKKCLETINLQLQGNTKRLKNPFHKDDLAWAAWIIARLGGWKGDPKIAQPGPITLKKGFLRFEDIFFGYNFHKPVIDTS